MKNNRNDLHVEQKRALVIMLIFTLLFSVIGISAVISVKTDCSWLNSLFRSKYTYSATMAESVSKDDYYQLNAGISFMLSPDSQAALNANVLMQPSDSNYTDAVDWNTGVLNAQCVAITAGLAKTYKLHIGDTVYSKHVVDGTIHEYTIDSILPEISSSIVKKTGINTDGVILMGYDNRYVDNITHTSLVFTDRPINELTGKISGMSNDIMYRTDEIRILITRILPYFVLFVLLAVLFAVALVHSLTRMVSFNFKRLVTLGYEKRKLDSAYNRLICDTGFASVLISFVIALALSHLFIFSLVAACVLCLLMIAEVTTILVSSWLSKRQLWR